MYPDNSSLVFFFVSIVVFPGGCCCLLLDGSPGSYLRYPQWSPCHNGSFFLEFSTRYPAGLLLYAQDFRPNTSAFLELKLVRGALRFRIRDTEEEGEGSGSISTGSEYGDGKYHSVALHKSPEATVVAVDGVQSGHVTTRWRKSDSPPAEYGHVFVGGLPRDLGVRQVVLSSALYEPRFRGSVRGVASSQCGGEGGGGGDRRDVEMHDGNGIRVLDDYDACSDHDPCVNGGQCISTDAGPLCDCARTDYAGINCDEG